MKKRNIKALIAYILSAQAVGGLSAWLSGNMDNFYSKYQKPPLLPPAWLFPVVWVILYILMAVAAYLVHYKPHAVGDKKSALFLYWAQLAVNFCWSIVFFRFEALRLSVAVIALLLVLIIAMVARFSKINKTAAYLNIPYIIWVAFAAYLNIATAVLNT